MTIQVAPLVQKSLLANHAECNLEGDLESPPLQCHRLQQTIGDDVARVELNAALVWRVALAEAGISNHISESSSNVNGPENDTTRGERRTKLGNNQAYEDVFGSDTDDDVLTG